MHAVAAPPPTSSLLSDRYELHEIVGQGGMGRVHRGGDLVLEKAVAVKLLAEHAGGSALERFRREAEASARSQTAPMLPSPASRTVSGLSGVSVMGGVRSVTVRRFGRTTRSSSHRSRRSRHGPG